ncbi:MAG: cytochrome c oxidase assembly protein [Actinomycetota bacterium]|nr:cytochrome c oxidase assembly protein [Actinomycetota bacterium]
MDPYAWSWDPDALVVVPALGLAYALALRRFPAPRWRVAAFLAGLALLLAVLITPVDTIALHYLLTAHLLQNVVLAEWAPLLCVLGLPPALAAALARLPGAGALVHPLVALPTWLAIYFAWHVPALYDAALRNVLLLHLEHACYFAAGVLLWWPVVHDAPRRLRAGSRGLYLFAAFLLASPLGLVLALVPEPIYSFYEDAPRLWGLSPLADQQIAGLTMSAEEAVVFFAAFAYFFARFLREDERDVHGAAARERAAAPH